MKWNKNPKKPEKILNILTTFHLIRLLLAPRPYRLLFCLVLAPRVLSRRQGRREYNWKWRERTVIRGGTLDSIALRTYQFMIAQFSFHFSLLCSSFNLTKGSILDQVACGPWIQTKDSNKAWCSTVAWPKACCDSRRWRIKCEYMLH